MAIIIMMMTVSEYIHTDVVCVAACVLMVPGGLS